MSKITLLLGLEKNLETLPFCLTGLRQQAVEEAELDVVILWNGTEVQRRILSEAGQIFPFRIVQCLPHPGKALEMILTEVQTERILFWDARFLPHRDLFVQHRLAYERAPEAVTIGTNHLHPQQAMTLFALAAQQQQLLFNFFPVQVPESQFSHFALHNCSLPLALLSTLTFRMKSLPFLAWDLGLQLWQKRAVFKLLSDASGAFLQPLTLSVALQAWQQACHQDLSHFLEHWSFLPPGLPPGLPTVSLQKASVYGERAEQQALIQAQNEICIPVEAGDAQDLRLAEYSRSLAQVWASEGLSQLNDLEPRIVDSLQRQAMLMGALNQSRPYAEVLPPHWFEMGEGEPDSPSSLEVLIVKPRALSLILAESASWLPLLPRGCLLLFPEGYAELEHFEQLLLRDYGCIRLPGCSHILFCLGLK